jgi:hypothetical protein
MRTNEQNARLHGLIGKLGIDKETKASLVWDVTGGRSESSKDLTRAEADKLIKHLEAHQGNTAETCNKIRRRIISHLIEMGAVTEAGDTDMGFIYVFIQQNWHKEFNSIEAKELAKIASVLRTKWLPWFYVKRTNNPLFSIKNEQTDSVKA